MNKQDLLEDEILVCLNCWGYKPCLCGNPNYIKMWRFVYEAFKNCKPTI